MCFPQTRDMTLGPSLPQLSQVQLRGRALHLRNALAGWRYRLVCGPVQPRKRMAHRFHPQLPRRREPTFLRGLQQLFQSARLRRPAADWLQERTCQKAQQGSLRLLSRIDCEPDKSRVGLSRIWPHLPHCLRSAAFALHEVQKQKGQMAQFARVTSDTQRK
ncbi:hypothetical protein RLO149_c030060 [Roseobacter litoralis Och 149]|uniref:Uncharacterized protein n=1 Tax=Roseobacter litoralis (strain ATCC 49566 / DSM 6996 / JCM 21268 / NBRC 15278 / OCh 149) TaxID=391595 RepID=F7ZI12_ROSLO|nr:hypothetical protein RLO149_c030060 [Roseobacter litoralis Och 149]